MIAAYGYGAKHMDNQATQYETNLKKTQKIGYTAILVTAGLTAGLARFTTIGPKIASVISGPISVAWFLALMQLLLLLYILVLALFWYVWTDWELDLFLRYLPMPPHRARDNVIVILGGIVLGLLIYFSDRIILFTSIFMICDAFAFLGTKDVDEAVADSIALRRNQPNKIGDYEREVLGALEDYYVRRPQLTRIACSAFVKLVALAVAIYGHLLVGEGPNSSVGLLVDYPNFANCLAYVLVLIGGIGSEIPITFWRVERETRIREAEASRPKNAAGISESVG